MGKTSMWPVSTFMDSLLGFSSLRRPTTYLPVGVQGNDGRYGFPSIQAL